jgi:hypothetical protein
VPLKSLEEFNSVNESSNQQRWPALQKDDDGLRDELFQLLTVHAPGDAYSNDGSFAANITQLPPGLRAMAATHCLDISLAIDSITWHFGNFGEPHLVSECFVEAKELMQPLLAKRTEADGDPHEILERAELTHRADELDRQASELGELGPGESAIYDAWVRYARQHPERVFIT